LNIGACSNFESRISKIKPLERFDSPARTIDIEIRAAERYTFAIDLDDILDSTYL
jgi:hypothetical protein